MKLLESKTATVIAMFLLLTIAVTIVALPNASAANRTVYCFLSVAPNPIGVDQAAFVVMWIDTLPPLYPNGTETAWQNYTLTINSPGGTTETLGPFASDAVASAFLHYTPDEIGTYVFQFIFSAQTAIDGNYYQAANSPKVSLVVQQEPIPQWTPTSLPTEFWTRPIYGENREWYTIGGNWLGVPLTFGNGYSSSGCFNSYTTGPESAHIVWTKEQAWGGIVGGNLTDVSYYTGLSYEGKYGPPIIMQGKLFCNLPLSQRSSANGAICLDLRTGEQLWWQNITLSVGQLYDYESPNQHGVIPYLWQTGGTYRMFDPFTGNLLLTLANASSGRVTMSPTGDMLVYVLNGPNNWLAMWNSSRAPYMLLGTIGTNAWQWRPPIGTTQDWRAGIQWNVTVPDVPGSQSVACIGEGVIVASSQADATTVTVVGYDATTGAQKWVINITSNAAIRPNYFIVPIGNGVFTFFRQETMQFYAYSINTGNLVWGPTEAYDNPWGMYTSSTSGLGASNPLIAYDTLYSVAYDGKVHAYNITNGKHLWDFSTGSSGFETPYGTYPLGGGTFDIADGKVYAATGEHSPNAPMWRGGRIYCVDAFSGKGIWNLTGWWQNPAVADGYLTAFNNYDCHLYCIGKGLSATTISASPEVSVHGNNVLIKGTVTDQSPGQTCLGIPAAGTPAISDDSMTQWTEYLYMQQPKPTNASGVEVSLDTFDPNGNYVHIGTVTSDSSGMFEKAFVPEVPGEYTIIATFGGSKSYYSSYAETAIDVQEAPPATPQPEYPQPIDYTMAIIGAVVVLLIAIAIVGILILRKHP